MLFNSSLWFFKKNSDAKMDDSYDHIECKKEPCKCEEYVDEALNNEQPVGFCMMRLKCETIDYENEERSFNSEDFEGPIQQILMCENMGSKRKRLERDGNAKKSRNVIPFHVKVDVLNRFDGGERAVSIARTLNLPTSTVRTIKQMKAKINMCVASNSRNTLFASKARNRSLETMEKVLLVWIEDQNRRDNLLSKLVIKLKARSIYSQLSEELGSSSTDQAFMASSGWFERFKRRSNLILCKADENVSPGGDSYTLSSPQQELVNGREEQQKITRIATSDGILDTGSYKQRRRTSLQDKAQEKQEGIANVEFEEKKNFLKLLKNIILEGGYNSKQVFSVDETLLFWKRLPATTISVMEEKDTAGLQVDPSHDYVTLLVGGNAEDFKLKPLLVYHEDTPCAMKGYVKPLLPVIWKSNRKGCMTSGIFYEWFHLHFLPALKEYCEKNDLVNKALLLMADAPGHPINLGDTTDNVKVVYLPAASMSLLCPEHQGAINIFKACYFRRIFSQFIKEIECERSVKGFWHSYSIMNAVDNIAAAWREIKRSTMNRGWQDIWPGYVNVNKFEDTVPELCKDIAKLAQQAGFNDMREEDVTEFLNCRMKIIADEGCAEESSVKPEPIKTLSLEILSEIISLFDKAHSLIEEHDPNRERSSGAIEQSNNIMERYRQMYQLKRRDSTVKLDEYLRSLSSGDSNNIDKASSSTAYRSRSVIPLNCVTAEYETPANYFENVHHPEPLNSRN